PTAPAWAGSATATGPAAPDRKSPPPAPAPPGGLCQGDNFVNASRDSCVETAHRKCLLLSQESGGERGPRWPGASRHESRARLLGSAGFAGLPGERRAGGGVVLRGGLRGPAARDQPAALHP